MLHYLFRDPKVVVVKNYLQTACRIITQIYNNFVDSNCDIFEFTNNVVKYNIENMNLFRIKSIVYSIIKCCTVGGAGWIG